MLAQVSDSKGDVLAYPKAVLSLPFSDSGNTFYFDDDYHVDCQGDFYDTHGGKVGHGLAAWSAMSSCHAAKLCLVVCIATQLQASSWCRHDHAAL